MFSAEGIQRNCVLQTLIQRPLASSLQSLYRCSYRKHSILYLFIICCKHYLKELDGHSVLLNIAAFLQLCAMIQIVSLDFPGIGSNSRRPDIPDDALVIFSDLDEVKGENLQSGLKRFKRICSAGPKDYSGHPDAEGLPKLKSSEGPSMHFWTANHELLTQKGRTLDSRALPYALQSS